MNKIVAEIAKRDESKIKKYIKSYLTKKITDIDEDDILQDTFVKLLEMSEITLPIEKLTFYIFRMAKNKIIDKFRKNKNIDKYINNEKSNLSELLSSKINSPEQALENKEIMKEVFEAIEKLPEKQKEIFLYTEIDNLTFKQVSDKTGESINTLLARKKYAIEKLQKSLRHLIEK